jgi:iron-sulfur cluster repair protein YtfE (RIC family)
VTETRFDTIPERDFAAHEHRELRPGIERMHEVVALRGTNEELSVAVLGVLHWVDTVLQPHAEWEDRWLYPEIDRRAGTHWATKLMTFEHEQIREAARALAASRAQSHQATTTAGVMELRARLAALEAILRAHLTREERFLIPLLEAEPIPAGAGAPTYQER